MRIIFLSLLPLSAFAADTSCEWSGPFPGTFPIKTIEDITAKDMRLEEAQEFCLENVEQGCTGVDSDWYTGAPFSLRGGRFDYDDSSYSVGYILTCVEDEPLRPGQDGHGLPPLMPGEDGHGLPPLKPGEDGHGLPPLKFGEDGHGLPPMRPPPLYSGSLIDSDSRVGKDGHGIRKPPPPPPMPPKIKGTSGMGVKPPNAAFGSDDFRVGRDGHGIYNPPTEEEPLLVPGSLIDSDYFRVGKDGHGIRHPPTDIEEEGVTTSKKKLRGN